jgi:membrane-associated PAP2 superfamily phosphatase
MRHPPLDAARRGWRLREREWSAFAGTLAFVSLVFAFVPALDLAVSGAFYRPAPGAAAFVGLRSPLVHAIYAAVPWIGRLAAIGAFALAAAAALRPGHIGMRWRRRALALGLALAVGVGAGVNGVLKNGWGRARPLTVAAFGGTLAYTPALRPARQCLRNCSFVSGHAATGFALAAVGLFGGAATRRRWLVVGAATGLGLGALRVAEGAHFASDVLYAGLVVWAVNLTLRELWLVRRARRARHPRRR